MFEHVAKICEHSTQGKLEVSLKAVQLTYTYVKQYLKISFLNRQGIL